MVKTNCVEDKRLSYNEGWKEGNIVGLFDGNKKGRVEGAKERTEDILTSLKCIVNSKDLNDMKELLEVLIRLNEKCLVKLKGGQK